MLDKFKNKKYIKKSVRSVNPWFNKDIEKQYNKAFNEYLCLIAFDFDRESEYYKNEKTVIEFWKNFHKTVEMIEKYNLLKNNE